MIKLYDFEYCRAEIYDDYILVYINEGVTVSPEHMSELNLVTRSHFTNKYFVYIAVRINSYTVNPMIYQESSKIKNLLGVAIVSNDPKQKNQAKIEQVFFEKKLKQFDTIKDALEWKDEIIKKHKID